MTYNADLFTSLFACLERGFVFQFLNAQYFFDGICHIDANLMERVKPIQNDFEPFIFFFYADIFTLFFLKSNIFPLGSPNIFSQFFIKFLISLVFLDWICAYIVTSLFLIHFLSSSYDNRIIFGWTGSIYCDAYFSP